MKLSKKLVIRIIVPVLLVFAYPSFVLGYTWSHVAASNLPGGRRGPLDAYRHTLASAVVAYTLSPRVVEWVTLVMERGGNSSSRMDRHNNRIGATIGLHANSFEEIERLVHAKVLDGVVNATDLNQVTWLPPRRWSKGWLR